MAKSTITRATLGGEGETGSRATSPAAPADVVGRRHQRVTPPGHRRILPCACAAPK